MRAVHEGWVEHWVTGAGGVGKSYGITSCDDEMAESADERKPTLRVALSSMAARSIDMMTPFDMLEMVVNDLHVETCADVGNKKRSLSKVERCDVSYEHCVLSVHASTQMCYRTVLTWCCCAVGAREAFVIEKLKAYGDVHFAELSMNSDPLLDLMVHYLNVSGPEPTKVLGGRRMYADFTHLVAQLTSCDWFSRPGPGSAGY